MKQEHPEHSHAMAHDHSESKPSYRPLIIILIFCLLMPMAQKLSFDLEGLMYGFMGYFFIFLSLFKFFDLRGFVDGFETYDLVTKHLRFYGYIYPFIEFGLGLGYLAQIYLLPLNWITLIVMLLSGIGVLKSLLSGQKIKCACLGTVLNVPLSSVSLLENFGMGIMAAVNLYLIYRNVWQL